MKRWLPLVWIPLTAQIVERTDLDSNEDGEANNNEEDSDNNKIRPLYDDM
jgi:hypothetical protein